MYIFIERQREKCKIIPSFLTFVWWFFNFSSVFCAQFYLHCDWLLLYIYRYTIYYMIFSSIFCLTQKQQVMKIKQNKKKPVMKNGMKIENFPCIIFLSSSVLIFIISIIIQILIRWERERGRWGKQTDNNNNTLKPKLTIKRNQQNYMIFFFCLI